MGFRFRKTFSVLPGVRVNMSKSGPSVSVGGKGLTMNFGKKGSKTTVGLPGSGMSYSSYKRYDEAESEAENGHRAQEPQGTPLRIGSLIPIVFIGLVFYAIYQGGGLAHIVKSKVTAATKEVQTVHTDAGQGESPPVTARAFTVDPASASACGLPYPCRLQPILDSADWPAVSAAFAQVIPMEEGARADWTGTVPARHGYVRHGKELASGNCVSYTVAAHINGKTVTRAVKLCERASGPPELK
jgi:hypothetical protein